MKKVLKLTITMEKREILAANTLNALLINQYMIESYGIKELINLSISIADTMTRELDKKEIMYLENFKVMSF